jgi:hypothetical protein
MPIVQNVHDAIDQHNANSFSLFDNTKLFQAIVMCSCRTWLKEVPSSFYAIEKILSS